jgi:hypothetical protein
MLIAWVNPTLCDPPHGVVRPEQVDDLVEAFIYSGWDRARPYLVGYWCDMRGHRRIQLLSGTHRWAAAFTIGLAIPVVIHDFETVDAAHGNLEQWNALMASGNP